MFHTPSVALIVLLAVAWTSSHELFAQDTQPCLSRSIGQVLLGSEREKLDCSSLPSHIQSALALHFTFCHLNATGIDPATICTLPSIDGKVHECLQNITRNSLAFLTYTNFVPHVQSICYAIETQQWHHQARQSIHQLNQRSTQVESEAKRLLVAQETLQDSLDQALTVNQHSVDDALSVDRFLQVAQTDVEELRGHLYVKDKAQIELIQQILETLFNVQTSLFADAFGLSSYVFYAVALIAIHILTIPERTSDAKFWLILQWLALIGVERYMLFFSSYPQMVLYDALWRWRQLWFLVSCLTLTYHAVRYRNYHKENQRLIDEIDRKHKQLEMAARKCLTVLNQLDMMDDPASDESMDDNDSSMSSTLTDNEEMDD